MLASRTRGYLHCARRFTSLVAGIRLAVLLGRRAIPESIKYSIPHDRRTLIKRPGSSSWVETDLLLSVILTLRPSFVAIAIVSQFHSTIEGIASTIQAITLLGSCIFPHTPLY